MATRSQDDLIKLLREQMEQQRQQMESLLAMVQDKKPSVVNTKFGEFDPSIELWSDYWARFLTFLKANSIPDDRSAEIFLTNQAPGIFRMLKNIACQQTPPKDVNQLTMEEMSQHMTETYDPKRFIVRERFRFWSMTDRKPGESVHDFATRIRQQAATCDFSSIRDPLDEAMRTKFVCSIKNEATLKALFKISDDELTFTRAIQVAAEAEEASRAARETVDSPRNVHTVSHSQNEAFNSSSYQQKSTQQQKHRFSSSPPQQQQRPGNKQTNSTKTTCHRCDGPHQPSNCRFTDAV